MGLIDPKKSEIMGKVFRDLHDTSMNEFSKSFVASLVEKYDLDLEDKVAQFYFQNWHDRRFIDWIREEVTYLRILKRGVELTMSSVLAIIAYGKDETGKDFYSQSGIAGFLKAHKLELENEEVQAVLQKWHNEGKIELVKDKDVYLRYMG